MEKFRYIEILIRKHLFTYHYTQPIEVGQEVLVPFRNGRASGYVVKIVPKPEFETKAIIDIVRPKPQFSADLAALADWISETYLCYRTKAMELILPK
jgi:primosomal protein N' (replication factor Y)